jgi:hypothetical protein
MLLSSEFFRLPIAHGTQIGKQIQVLYENSGKTADEVCKVVGVGRRIFFSYLAQQRDQQSTPLIAN